ncbi:hypothetical protein [Burkholderia sp. AW49-1]
MAYNNPTSWRPRQRLCRDVLFDHAMTARFLGAMLAPRKIALRSPILASGGSYAVIVLMAINREHFQNVFTGLSLGLHGSLSLMGKDGIMVMRQPYEVRSVGRDACPFFPAGFGVRQCDQRNPHAGSPPDAHARSLA